MKTVAACVEEIIASQPFLEEGLSRQIINFSALAKDLKNQVSTMLKKPIKTGAIMMALRRYNYPSSLDNSASLRLILKNLGDITVRSNLSDFTFKNSKTLINCHSAVLENISAKNHIFYAFTRGVFESNIIISSSEKQHV